jgi:hypothetical protein
VTPPAEPRQAQPGLTLRTLGHACLALYRYGEAPLLITDPWLVGSVYWRSWWLQNYPTPEEVDWLTRSRRVYVTHEHPDHFHMPSIRRLGRGPAYLFPDLAEPGYLAYMGRHGYCAELVPPSRWQAIGEDVSILSIPVWNDDSLLLIDTPTALILNLNDAKPPRSALRAIRRMADRIDKPRILLCSYSPASCINSFLDETGIVSLKPAQQYVDHVCRLSAWLAADFYLPFASQAVFERRDSCWANDYRTTYDDLQRYWQSETRLLPPYTTIDLTDFTTDSTPPERYRRMERSRLAELTGRRVAEEESTALAAEDIIGLERKLNVFRWFLWLFFLRGFAFQLGEQRLRYNALRGRLEEASRSGSGDFIVVIPKLAVKEAVRNNHVSELAISMFVRIRLLRRADPRKIYALFAALQLDDYGHLTSSAALLRWMGRGVRHTFALRLPVPPLPKAIESVPGAVSRGARPIPDAPLFARIRPQRRLAGRFRFR